MAKPLSDPQWPAGLRPDAGRAVECGGGAGGRRYLRLRLPGPWGQTLFVKDFGPGGRALRAARREFRAAARLRAAGAPCPRPWLAARAGGGRAWLLVEDCGEGAPLEPGRILAETGLLERAAEAAADLHRAGVAHGDLHAGNLLRAPDGRLLWTDLRRARWNGAPARSASRDLGCFLAALEPIPPRALLRFARAYLARRSGAPPASRAVRAVARAASSAAAARLRAHACNLDRRARRALRGLHPRAWREPELVPLREALEDAGSEALKVGDRSQVVRFRLDTTTVIVKHFRRRRRLDPRDALGRSKAMRNLLAAEALRRRGLPAARPLAAWSRRGRGSWLVLEDLGDHLPLHEAVLRVEGAARAELLGHVSRLVRRLHRLGVYYRDLKPSNVLVQLSASPPRIALVDHDRNRFRRREIAPWRARRDLAALHAGLPPQVRASERFLALRAYDARWTSRPAWRAHVRPLLREAAGRRHRWVPRALLSGGGVSAP